MDFKKLAQERKEEWINDTKELVKFESIKDVENKAPGAPFGLEIKKSLDWVANKARQDGFKVEEFDGYAIHIEYGEGDQIMGILGHLDVVTVNKDNWDSNPFEVIEKDGYLFGRGVSDDKGPSLMAYHALKALKDSGYKPKKRIRIILGGDEESGWECMHHYFEVAKQPKPNFGFSPDAEFPLINAEKEMYLAKVIDKIKSEDTKDSQTKVISINSGKRKNIVPEKSEVVLKTTDKKLIDEIKNKFENKINGDEISFIVPGKPFHGMAPQNGINAFYETIKFLNNYEMDSSFKKLYNFINEKFLDDHFGKKMDYYHKDDYMGETTQNLGIANYNNGKIELHFNIRVPKDTDTLKLIKNFENLEYKTQIVKELDLTFVPEDSKIVSTLMRVYKEVTKDQNAKPFSIGGATYAKTFPNCVAFGHAFLDRNRLPIKIHEENESVHIDDAVEAIEIYMKAIYELTKDAN